MCASEDPLPAIHYGQAEYFGDDQGHVLLQNQPLGVRNKTAAALLGLGRDNIFASPPTCFYDGEECC